MSNIDLIYLCTGIVLGSLIGVALPRPWIKTPPARHAAHRDTWFHQHLVGIVMCLVLLFCLLMGSGVLVTGIYVHRQGEASDELHHAVTVLEQQRRELLATEQRQHDEIVCQATVNQALTARSKAVAGPARRAVLAPRAFFEVLLPALTGPHFTQEQMAALTPMQRHAVQAQQHRVLEDLIAANHAANTAYDDYLESQEAHPLPPLPSQLCDVPPGDH